MPKPTQPPERQIELSEQLARATAELSEARTENKLPREKIDALVRRIFGAQSESSGAR